MQLLPLYLSNKADVVLTYMYLPSDDSLYVFTGESLQELAFKLSERKEIARPYSTSKVGRTWSRGLVARNS